MRADAHASRSRRSAVFRVGFAYHELKPTVSTKLIKNHREAVSKIFVIKYSLGGKLEGASSREKKTFGKSEGKMKKTQMITASYENSTRSNIFLR